MKRFAVVLVIVFCGFWLLWEGRPVTAAQVETATATRQLETPTRETTPTMTATVTATVTETVTQTPTATATEEPTMTATPTGTASPTATATPEDTPTVTVTAAPTVIPSNQVLTAVDGLLVELWPQLLAAQSRYYAETGQFFQGLQTHSQVPADGSQVEPDQLWAKPTDQAETWLYLDMAAFNPLAQLPYMAWIDTYQTRQGAGFVICMQVVVTGRLYEKCRNYGPELSRSRDWQEVEVE